MNISAKERGRVPELIDDLEANLSAFLSETSLSEAEAESISAAFIDYLMHEWGGQVIYIPTGTRSIRIHQRDVDIYRDFRGDNHHELSKKYNISMQWIYKIIKRMGKIDIEKRQTKLFDDFKSCNDNKYEEPEY